MKQMFFKEDVEKPVTYIMRAGRINRGKIKEFRHADKYSLLVDFGSTSHLFDVFGRAICEDCERSLYHGHNMQVQITGEEVPERYVTKYVNLYPESQVNTFVTAGSMYDTSEEAAKCWDPWCVNTSGPVEIEVKINPDDISTIQDATEGRRL